jgi:hypothetical protein
MDGWVDGWMDGWVNKGGHTIVEVKESEMAGPGRKDPFILF